MNPKLRQGTRIISVLFLLAFGCMTQIGFGQVQFEIFNDDDNGGSDWAAWVASLEIEEGFFLSGVVGPDSFLVMMKLNLEGEVIDSVHYYGSDGKKFNIDNLLETDSSYLLIGTSYNAVDTFPSLWIGEFSKDLAFQKESLFPFPWNKHNRYIHYYWEADSDTVLFATGFSYLNAESYKYGWVNIKNKESHFVKSIEYLQWADIVPRRDSSGYLVTGIGLQYLDDTFSRTKFNPFWRETLGDGLAGVDVEYINDTTLFIASTYDCLVSKEFVKKGDRGIFVGVMDKDLNLIHHDTLLMNDGDETAWYLFPLRLKLVARSTDSTFIVAGRRHPHKYNYSGIYCAKYNAKAERIWYGNYYPSMTNQFYIYSILATKDGGCLMSGGMTDLGFPHFYIIKIGADGLLTSEITIPVDMAPIKLYPNPTSDIITFDMKGDYRILDFELVDLAGHIVLRQKVTGHEEISTSHLPKGVYGYRLLGDKGEVLYSGKMVKE